MLHDWHQLHTNEPDAPAIVDPRRRLRICLGLFVAAMLVVFGRAVQLEWTHGAAYRAEAVKPVLREIDLPAPRGRILARDGTVLVGNREVPAVAVHYRYLQEPPDPEWLRSAAVDRLTPDERKDPRRVEAEQARVRNERVESARRLAELCGLSIDEWNRRARRIQTRVQRIADSVNRRRTDEGNSMPVTVKEERDYHVLAAEVSLAAVARIEEYPERYPGVKTLRRTRRIYPAGPLAAHIVGHLGQVSQDELEEDAGVYRPKDLVGRMGIERQYESLLRGRRGTAVEQTDHGGYVLSTHRRREPIVGSDLTLTLHPSLQRAAESLLDDVLRRGHIGVGNTAPAGGSIVVMDVQNGELWVAASAPTFDPRVFTGGDARAIERLLGDPAHSLFDRTRQMAIPPGSVFKVLAAVALLESRTIKPDAPFFCQGYLHEPDRQRCAIYRRDGIGHDEVTLADALAQSCNVYFFHHAAELGPEPLIDMAVDFGLGRPTGVDLPGEAVGRVPTPATIRRLEGHPWRPGDTQSLVIGQGSLTTTPLQIARAMAAIANGGRLLTPHLHMGRRESNPPQLEIHPDTLTAVREGLRRVVADPAGTAHGAAYIEDLAIAGKTGTAETGADRAPHAWFAGYVPAEAPKFVLVVVLEHAGDAASVAVPVVKRLVLQMQRQGLL